MTKQNNYVAKHNFNKGGFHEDKSKAIPREGKYDDMKEFVDNLYADGKKPCERFGINWEELEEIEKVHEEYFNDVQGEEKI